MNDFTGAATRLAGIVGALFGWRPHEFWTATPAELAALFTAFREEGQGGVPAARSDLDRLMENFPDG